MRTSVLALNLGNHLSGTTTAEAFGKATLALALLGLGLLAGRGVHHAYMTDHTRLGPVVVGHGCAGTYSSEQPGVGWRSWRAWQRPLCRSSGRRGSTAEEGGTRGEIEGMGDWASIYILSRAQAVSHPRCKSRCGQRDAPVRSYPPCPYL